MSHVILVVKKYSSCMSLKCSRASRHTSRLRLISYMMSRVPNSDDIVRYFVARGDCGAGNVCRRYPNERLVKHFATEGSLIVELSLGIGHSSCFGCVNITVAAVLTNGSNNPIQDTELFGSQSISFITPYLTRLSSILRRYRSLAQSMRNRAREHIYTFCSMFDEDKKHIRALPSNQFVGFSGFDPYVHR